MKHAIHHLLKLSIACDILLFCLPSCEWDSNEENFVHTPLIDHSQVSIDLAGVNPSQVIEIPNNGLLYYSLSSKEARGTSLRFFLDGEELYNLQTNNKYVMIQSPDESNKVRNLKAVLTYNDNSLVSQLMLYANGEQSGMGLYTKEYNYQVRILPENASRLHIKQSLHESKYMALSWDAPQGMDVKQYKIYKKSGILNSLIATIDANDRHFVDKDYAYGYEQYTIEAVMTGSFQPSYEEIFVPAFITITSDDVKIHTTSTTSHYDVSWTNPNPHPAKYVLQINNSNSGVNSATTQTSVPRQNFFPGNWSDRLRIYVLPPDADNASFQHYNYTEIELADPQLEHGEFYNAVSFNQTNKRLYVPSFSGVHSYDATQNMKYIATSTQPLIETTGATMVPSQSGQMILYNISTLTVYRDDSFAKKQAVFPNVYDYRLAGDWLLIDNYESTGVKPILYNTNTMTTATIDNIDDYKGDYLHPTPDGKHLIACYTEAKLLKLENNKLTEVGKLDKAPLSIAFNPLNPNEAIFTYREGSVNIVDMSTFTVKRTISGNFRNIDPVSGRMLLYTSYDSEPIEFVVLDSSFAQEVKRIKVSYAGNTEGYIFNDIFVYNGYFSKY